MTVLKQPLPIHDIELIWKNLLSLLEGNLSQPNYQTLVASCRPVTLMDGLLTVGTDTDFLRDYVSKQCTPIFNVILGNNWSEGFDVCATGCELDYKTKTAVETSFNELKSYQDTFLNVNSDGFYSYDSGEATIFKRKVTIIQPTTNIDILKVDILVTWNYNSLPFNFNTIGYIYNLQ